MSKDRPFWGIFTNIRWVPFLDFPYLGGGDEKWRGDLFCWGSCFGVFCASMPTRKTQIIVCLLPKSQPTDCATAKERGCLNPFAWGFQWTEVPCLGPSTGLLPPTFKCANFD